MSKPVSLWKQTNEGPVLVLENDLFRVELRPEQGGAVTSYVHKPASIDVIWMNRYCRSHKMGLLDQPTGSGSDLYDIMDGSWYVSLPNGFFAGDYFGAPLGTHGELRTLPWEVEALHSSGEEIAVVLKGVSVRTPFVYRRELTISSDCSYMTWEETVQNRSSEALPIAWVHHPTFGGSLLDGARLIAPARKVHVYRSDEPESLQLQAGYTGEWPLVPERLGGAFRDCSIVPTAGSGLDHSVQISEFTEGWGCIWNEKLRFGFSLAWDLNIFPYAWSWACSGGIKRYPLWGDGHIFTLQPSTSPVGRFPELLKSNSLCLVPGNGEVRTEMRTGFVNRPGSPVSSL